MVYALINRETMLDLQPGRSVVQNLLNAGVEVYMVDWGYPTRKDRYLTISVEKSVDQTLAGKPVAIKDVAADDRVQHKQEKARECLR